jgi:branched-chain amino acid transport system ATP-binding protein
VSLLECKGLTRRFGALIAVDNVYMAVEKGEIRAVIGPNGAGKSTLFNLINGVLKPSAGSAIFAGERISGLPVYRVVQKGISRTFQLTHLFAHLTARENVRIAAQARLDGRWRPLGGASVEKESRKRADAALERLRLGGDRGEPAFARRPAAAGDRHGTGAGTETSDAG